MSMIEAHQCAALLAFIFMEITGSASLIGLLRFSRTVKNPWMSAPGRLNLLAVLFLALLTSGLMAVAGNTGGDIRHSEIVSGQGETSTIGTFGAGLMGAIHHFVIDSSMWVWPVLEDLHFLGLILLLGSVGWLILRFV